MTIRCGGTPASSTAAIAASAASSACPSARLVDDPRLEVAPGIPRAARGRGQDEGDVGIVDGQDEVLEHVRRVLRAAVHEDGDAPRPGEGAADDHRRGREVRVQTTFSRVSSGSSWSISLRRSSQCGGMHMCVPSSSSGSSMKKPCSVLEASSNSAPPGVRRYTEWK